MKRIINLFFFWLSRCTSSIDSEFLSDLQNFETKKTCIKDYELVEFDYCVYLHLEDNDKGNCVREKSVVAIKSYTSFFLKMYDEREVSNFIGKLKRKTKCNYTLYFCLENRKEELVKFIKYFSQKLEEEKIDKVQIMYKYDKLYLFFYNVNGAYIELLGNQVVLREREDFENQSFLKTTYIKHEFITRLMKDDFDLYFRHIKDSSTISLLKKFFFNHRLLLFNSKYFKDDIYIRNTFYLRHTTKFAIQENFEGFDLNGLPDIRYLNVLLFFLKETYLFENIIDEIVDTNKDLEYNVLIRILNDLQIGFSNEDKLGVNYIQKRLSPDSNSLSFKKSINEIMKVNIEDNIINYEKVSIFFYLLLRKIEYSVLDDLIEIIKRIIIESNFEEVNKKVFEKMMGYFKVYKSWDFVCFDIFHEKTYNKS